jgi:hypothetical protein
MQIVLFDDEPRPDEVEQLPLAQDAVPPICEREQQVEGARSADGRLTVDEEFALRSAYYEVIEGELSVRTVVLMALSASEFYRRDRDAFDTSFAASVLPYAGASMRIDR